MFMLMFKLMCVIVAIVPVVVFLMIGVFIRYDLFIDVLMTFFYSRKHKDWVGENVSLTSRNYAHYLSDRSIHRTISIMPAADPAATPAAGPLLYSIQQTSYSIPWASSWIGLRAQVHEATLLRHLSIIFPGCTGSPRAVGGRRISHPACV